MNSSGALQQGHAADLAWTRPQSPPALHHGHVHIWRADLNLPAERIRHFISCFDAREQRRMMRYTHAQARQRYVASRGLLKEILALYVACDAPDIRFRFAQHGKPYLDLPGAPAIQFNSTDSQAVALYAICLSSEIGIDAEIMNRTVRHDLIAPRRFSRRELECYRKRNAGQRKSSFLSIWTRKEAYGKAKGVGILYSMKDVNLVGEDEWVKVRIIDPDGLPWEIAPVLSDCGIVATVAAAGAGWCYEGFKYPLAVDA